MCRIVYSDFDVISFRILRFWPSCTWAHFFTSLFEFHNIILFNEYRKVKIFLSFCLTSVTIKAAGVRLPARLLVWDSGLLVRCCRYPFYFVFDCRMISAASSGVLAVASTSFASVSRNALNSAFVIPLSIPSLPF